MKTDLEIVTDIFEEDGKFTDLIREYRYYPEAIAKADALYQEGVRVDEIANTLREDLERALEHEQQSV